MAREKRTGMQLFLYLNFIQLSKSFLLLCLSTKLSRAVNNFKLLLSYWMAEWTSPACFPSLFPLVAIKSPSPLGHLLGTASLTAFNQRTKIKRQIHNHCASSNKFLIIQWKDAEVCGRTKSIKWFPVYAAVLGTIDYVCRQAKLLQSCPALWDSMDHSAPGSSVQGILQARIPEWVAMPSFSRSPQPRGWTKSLMPSTQSGRFFITSATWEAYNWLYPARHLSLSPQKYSSISGSVCLVFLICKIWGNSMYLIGMMWRLHELQEFGTAAGT